MQGCEPQNCFGRSTLLNIFENWQIWSMISFTINHKHLLSIGYNADEHRRDNSFYDLLASEARLCTFVGIAQGKLPQESWFALGRQLTNTGADPILLSWSGSMFEYLMPLLVMPTYENTLLDQTNKACCKDKLIMEKNGSSLGYFRIGI